MGARLLQLLVYHFCHPRPWAKLLACISTSEKWNHNYHARVRTCCVDHEWMLDDILCCCMYMQKHGSLCTDESYVHTDMYVTQCPLHQPTFEFSQGTGDILHWSLAIDMDNKIKAQQFVRVLELMDVQNVMCMQSRTDVGMSNSTLKYKFSNNCFIVTGRYS